MSLPTWYMEKKKRKKPRKAQELLFAGGANTENMPSTELTEEDFQDGSIDLITMLVKTGLVPSRSEGRRAIEQGGVSIDGEKITDIKHRLQRKTSAMKEWSFAEARRNSTKCV